MIPWDDDTEARVRATFAAASNAMVGAPIPPRTLARWERARRRVVRRQRAARVAVLTVLVAMAVLAVYGLGNILESWIGP